MPYGQTPSLANSGSSTMSNANNSPRNMSASDYTRIQRLRAMYDYKARIDSNADVTNPTPGRSIDVFTGFGIGKYRRTASDWISYRSAQTSDYVVTQDRGEPGMGKIQTARTLCQCPNPISSSLLMAKDNICIKCKYSIV